MSNKEYIVGSSIVDLRKQYTLSEVACARLLRVSLAEYTYIEQGQIEPATYREIYQTLKKEIQMQIYM